MPHRSAMIKTTLALALAMGAACVRAKSPESPGAVLIDRMIQLTQAPTLTLELVRDTLEVAFTVDEKSSHDMVTFFVGAPRTGSTFDGLIKLVDCRVPTEQNTALKEPFVVVELQTTTLLAKDIVAKLGQPYSFDPALPEDPETWGNTIFKYALRSLWVSFGRKDPDKVRSVSIHPLEDVR